MGKPKGGSKNKKEGKVDGNEQKGEAQGSARDERGSAGKKEGGTATAMVRFWATCYRGRLCA